MKTHATRMLLAGVLLPATFRLHAANVVTDWNTIAATTIVANGGKASVASGVFFAYTFIAVYDAVNAVHRVYEPFYYQGNAPDSASEEAAAAAAAHRVLVYYFPGQQAALDAAFTTSLNGINGSAQGKARGVATGEAAAAALISARRDDGLEAAVPYTPGNGPGVWQPTPPALLPALTPWLGQMRPFTLESAHQFLPDGPTPLASERWTAGYNETRLFGDVNSTVRTAPQSEIGLFWAVHTGQQYSGAFGRLAENYQLSVMDSARLLAMLWTGYADAGIACWNAKFTYKVWRPVTAIRAGGGNSELTAYRPGHRWRRRPITPSIRRRMGARRACLRGWWRTSSGRVRCMSSWITPRRSATASTRTRSTTPATGWRKCTGRGSSAACIFITLWRTAQPSASRWRRTSLRVTSGRSTVRGKATANGRIPVVPVHGGARG
jgi:hypothetical protein